MACKFVISLGEVTVARLPSSEAQARRPVALIFPIDPIHLVRRDMPRTQLAWSEVTPRIDVDAVGIGNTEQLLHLAHRCADALVFGIDQMDAGYPWHRRTRHAVNRVSALRVPQPLAEATVAGRRMTVDGHA